MTARVLAPAGSESWIRVLNPSPSSLEGRPIPPVCGRVPIARADGQRLVGGGNANGVTSRAGIRCPNTGRGDATCWQAPEAGRRLATWCGGGGPGSSRWRPRSCCAAGMAAAGGWPSRRPRLRRSQRFCFGQSACAEGRRKARQVANRNLCV